MAKGSNLFERLTGGATETKDLQQGYLTWAKGLPYPSIVTDFNGKIIDMNELFIDLAGYYREDIEDQRIYWFLDNKEGKEIKEELKKLKDSRRISKEIRIPSEKEGKRFLLTIIPIKEQGEIRGFSWVFNNLNDHEELQKQVQKQLQEELERLYKDQRTPQIERSYPVGTWIFDFIKEDFFASLDTYRIFEREPEEFDGTLDTLLTFVHENDREALQASIEKSYQGTPMDLVFTIITKKEREKKVHSRGEIFYREEKEPDKMVGTIQDITARHTMEKNLVEKNKGLLNNAGRDLRNKSEKTVKEFEQEMNRSFEGVRNANQAFRMGIWTFDLKSNSLQWSKGTFEIYGRNPEKGEPTVEEFIENVHPEDRDQVQQVMENPPQEPYFEINFRILHPKGDIHFVKHLVEVVYENGEPRKIRGNIQDATEQKELEEKARKAQEELENLQHRFQLMMDHSEDIAEIIDEKGRITYISPAVKRIMGYENEDFKGKYIWDFVKGEEKQRLKDLVELSVKNPGRILREKIATQRKDHKAVVLEMTMTNHLQNSIVKGIILNWKDITDRVKMRKEIEYLAYHDESTGLPNRAAFKKQLTEEIQRHKKQQNKLAVVMIDIEDFKRINGWLGVELGDVLMKRISEEVFTSVSPKKPFLTRYYGGQLALIFTEIQGILDTKNLVESIVQRFDQSIQIDQYEVQVKISIGISLFPGDGRNIEEINNYSMVALDRARETGENNYQFHSTNMDVKNYKEFSLRNDLRKAIEKDELELYFQPIVQLDNGDILALEALIRWQHPKWGRVLPDEFISIAESTRLIIPMGRWVLDKVCGQYRKWLDQGYPKVKISVNYSGIQFLRRDFIKDITDTLEKYDLDPSFLILEITESVLIEQRNQTEKDIAELQAMGIEIAIDDFGTGYSSLTYLNTMNVDILKIDQEFIRDMEDNLASKKILEAIINLSKELKIRIVAEGIENWSQLLYLRRLNCMAGQGYLYSPPVQIKEIDKILKRGRIRPNKGNDGVIEPREERRKYYRIDFQNYLEADMTILEIDGTKADVGNTRTLIKNMGPGGLCFISNINFPIKQDLILQFTSEILEERFKVNGSPVWTKEVEPGLHTYGLKFTFDENARSEITRLLNQVQIRMRNEPGFKEGRFISISPRGYFLSKN